MIRDSMTGSGRITHAHMRSLTCTLSTTRVQPGSGGQP